MKKSYFDSKPSIIGAIFEAVGLIILFFACLAGVAAVFKFFEDPHAVIYGIPISIHAILGISAWIILFKVCKK